MPGRARVGSLVLVAALIGIVACRSGPEAGARTGTGGSGTPAPSGEGSPDTSAARTERAASDDESGEGDDEPSEGDDEPSEGDDESGEGDDEADDEGEDAEGDEEESEERQTDDAEGGEPDGEDVGSLEVSSEAFEQGGRIPTEYTCEGEDVSPPLSWSGVPDEAESLALVVDDPDAPDPKDPEMTWVHWVVHDIPPEVDSLPKGASPDELPDEAAEGTNNFDRTSYGGPCPPIGEHRYFHKLYALDTTLDGLDAPTKDTLREAMEGHVLAKGELMGTYEKSGSE